MVQLLDLSNELHLLIIHELPPDAVSSLALANRRLHQLVNPRLYESIFYCWESPQCYHGKYSHEPEATRIYDLRVLGRTLQHSPYLRSHVKRLDLTWGHGTTVVNSENVLLFLDVMKHTRFESLILIPPSLCFPIPAHTAVKKVELRPQGNYIMREGNDLVLNWLHKHCCISGP